MIRSAAGIAPPCGTIERDTGLALLGVAGFGPSEDRARRAEKLERVRPAAIIA
jgi:hypothetical protein